MKRVNEYWSHPKRMKQLLFCFLSLLASLSISMGSSTVNQQPNIILINCDDLGYGDLGCYGSTLNRTPNIDRIAEEGMLFTSYYSTSGLCTPSRASLLTGSYPVRINMASNYRGECVVFPVDEKGLHPGEVTLAELLKQQDYATAIIGKWHLGDQPQFLPTKQGFDYYYGIPYSNDTDPDFNERTNRPRAIYQCPPIPLLENGTVIEAPVDQNTITKRYTEKALDYIESSKDRHFFLYLAHTMPHLPLHASEKFRGSSDNGIYGDAVEEIDWSTGQIMQLLEDLDLDHRTLVIFTSDNGATHRAPGASNAPLSGFKGTTMEGGMRVPCIMQYPGVIPAGSVSDALISAIDIFPTLAALSGCRVPDDRVIDGKDISDILKGREGAASPHQFYCYYMLDQLQAVRTGNWKLHLPLEKKIKNFWNFSTVDAPLALFNLETDVAEATDVSDQHPEIVRLLLMYAMTAREAIEIQNTRPAGYEPDPRPLLINETGQ